MNISPSVSSDAGRVHVVIMSGSPSQVAELVPHDPVSRDLVHSTRELVVSVAGAEAVDIVSSRDPRWRTDVEGSLQAWGAPDVTVGQGNHLGEIVQRYVLGPDIAVREARGQIGALSRVTVVAVDGSAGMTARAPLALVDSAPEMHETLCAFLRGYEVTLTAAELERAGVLEPELWLELHQLRPSQAELLHADSHLGVGRYLARWTVTGMA